MAAVERADDEPPERAAEPAAGSTAVITFARSAAGGRVVRIPMSGALTSGTKRPQRTTAAPTTGHDTGATTIQSGSVAATIPKLASRSGEKRSSSFIDEHRADDRADPEAVKIQPATCGSRS